MVKKTSALPLKTLRQIISEQTPGSWVAISLYRKSVVGLGISPEEAKLVANANGEAEVVLLKVPERAFDRATLAPRRIDATKTLQVRRDAPEEAEQFIRDLRARARTVRVCQRCGSAMLVVNATFAEWEGDRSWDIPLPFCPECDSEMFELAKPQ